MKKLILPLMFAFLFTGCDEEKNVLVVILPQGENFESLTILKNGDATIQTSFESETIFRSTRYTKFSVEQKISNDNKVFTEFK